MYTLQEYLIWCWYLHFLSFLSILDRYYLKLLDKQNQMNIWNKFQILFSNELYDSVQLMLNFIKFKVSSKNKYACIYLVSFECQPI